MSEEKTVWRAPENRASGGESRNEKKVYGGRAGAPSRPQPSERREAPPPRMEEPRRELQPLENRPRVGIFLAWFIPAIVIFVLGFAAAVRWDLLIDERVHDPGSIFAVAFECFGWYPAFLPVILFVGLWAAARGASLWKRILGGFLALVGMLVLYYAAYHYMEKRGWANGFSDYRTWTWLAVGVLVIILLAFWLFNLNLDTRNRLFFFGIAGTAYMIANQVVIYAVKLLWGRPRFDDMLAGGSFGDFRAWFEPLGPGGSSFPSAHTANAAGIFCLIVLCDIFPKLSRHRKLCYLICWVYIAAMAAARIQMGRHFLSDTLAAAGIMALLFFAMRKTKIYKRGCEAASAGTLRIFGEKR